jgi:hypothetical protein
MAPIKFEDQMKDKLEQRRIQPSADAWNKLSSKLDEVHNKKERSFLWLGIAASTIGVLLVFNFLFSKQESTNEPTVVDTEVIPSSEPNNEVVEFSEDVKSIEMESNDTNDRMVNSNTIVEEVQPAIESSKLVEENSYKVVNQLDEVINNSDEANSALSFEAQKVQEVVDKILALQETDKTSVDSEVDSLLNAAQQEIKLNKLYEQVMQTVDANVLLHDVENDLDVSFRDKVFKALKSGYKSVKTAVAERNN